MQVGVCSLAAALGSGCPGVWLTEEGKGTQSAEATALRSGGGGSLAAESVAAGTPILGPLPSPTEHYCFGISSQGGVTGLGRGSVVLTWQAVDLVHCLSRHSACLQPPEDTVPRLPLPGW